MLQQLVGQGLLEQVGQKRGTFYRLPSLPGEAVHSGDHLVPSRGDLVHSGPDMVHSGRDLVHSIPVTELPDLQAAAEPARRKARLPKSEMERILLTLCSGRHLTAKELGELVKRDPTRLQLRMHQPLVAAGKLALRHPDKPRRPDQAYTTVTAHDAGRL